MALSDDLRRAADAAVRYAEPGEELTGIIPTEPTGGRRLYVCSYGDGESRTWLVVDERGRAVAAKRLVRDAVSIAALCELAEEHAAGGDLDELASQLAELRLTEAPEGVEDAEEAVRELQRAIGTVGAVASPERLDEIGRATRRLEEALGDRATSPFAESMKGGMASVDALAGDVERRYKAKLV